MWEKENDTFWINFYASIKKIENSIQSWVECLLPTTSKMLCIIFIFFSSLSLDTLLFYNKHFNDRWKNFKLNNVRCSMDHRNNHKRKGIFFTHRSKVLLYMSVWNDLHNALYVVFCHNKLTLSQLFGINIDFVWEFTIIMKAENVF